MHVFSESVDSGVASAVYLTLIYYRHESGIDGNQATCQSHRLHYVPVLRLYDALYIPTLFCPVEYGLWAHTLSYYSLLYARQYQISSSKYVESFF